LKKILHISFAFVFTVLTVGITINKHYSDGKLFSVALYGEAEACCDEPCECCDDESNIIQFTADYLFSAKYDLDNSLNYVELLADHTFELLSSDNEINNIGSKYLFSDIPPPEVRTFLSRIQTFLL
jgi:hypothetical protein